MQEILNLILSVVRAVFRFKWTVLFGIWTLSLLGWAFVYQLDERYSASARVFVDSNRILKPLLKGITVQPDVNQRVNLLSRTLLNRPNLEKLARMSDLDVEATTDYEKELLIDKLSANVRLTGTRGNSSVYSVRYSHADPATAKRVVQSLLTIFVESAIGDEREDTKVTQDFLDSQKAHYENRLAEADAKLASFRRKNFGLLPEDRQKNELKLDELKSELLTTKQELAVAESTIEVYRDQLSRQPKNVVQRLESTPTVSGIDKQLEEQRSELASLSAKYTERYPRIAQLRQSIEALEKRRVLEGADSSSNNVQYTSVSNPVYDELRVQNTLAEIQVGALKRRIADAEQSMEQLELKLDSMPDVAKELNRLVRGNESILETYNQILGRRESARLSEQVEQNVDDVTFRVIDPPFVASNAKGPSKALLNAGVLLAALAASIATAFAFAQLSPVFYDADTVARKTGRHVLGSVGNRMSPSRRSAKWMALGTVLLLLGLLLLIFLIIEAYYLNYLSSNRLGSIMQSPLGPVIDRIIFFATTVVDELKKLFSN